MLRFVVVVNFNMGRCAPLAGFPAAYIHTYTRVCVCVCLCSRITLAPLFKLHCCQKQIKQHRKQQQNHKRSSDQATLTYIHMYVCKQLVQKCKKSQIKIKEKIDKLNQIFSIKVAHSLHFQLFQIPQSEWRAAFCGGIKINRTNVYIHTHACTYICIWLKSN